MSEISIQQKLINLLQEKVSDKLSIVFELSELLEMSNDSIYRRLRNETLLTIEDIRKICLHYQLSFDQLCSDETNLNVSFQFKPINNKEDFATFLTDIRNDLKKFRPKKNVKIVYAAIDIPIFHNFRFPILSAFKNFYWLKSIANEPELQNVKFSTNISNAGLFSLTQEILELYCQIPSVEIWTHLILNSLISQISYYWDSGEFQSMEDALILCDEVKKEFEWMKLISEKGSKLDSENSNESELCNFKAYFCDIEIANNCIQVTAENLPGMTYLSTQTYNKLSTSNTDFNRDVERWLNNILKKSTLISLVGEKTRNQFFKRAFNDISRLEDHIRNN